MILYTHEGKDYDLSLPVDWEEPKIVSDLKSLRVVLDKENFTPFRGFVSTKKNNKKALETFLGYFKTDTNLVFASLPLSVKNEEKEAFICCYLIFNKIRNYKFLTFQDLFMVHFTDTTDYSITSLTNEFDSFVLDLGTEDYHSKYNDVPVGCFLDNIENSSKSCLIIYRGNKNLDPSIKDRIEKEPRWLKIKVAAGLDGEGKCYLPK